MIGVTLIVMIFALILLGVPIFAALGATGTMGLIFLQSRSALGGISWITIPQSIYSGIASFPLLAIPFFIFAGEIMNRGKITEKLIKFALMLIGRMPASLAQANIVASMFFGGVTGSAQADTSAIGGMLIPAMIKEGYSKETAVAVTASSSTVGPIIPPSIMMVIYGVCVGTSVGAMFLGGFIPGLMVGFGLMIVVALQDRTMHFPRRTGKMTWEEKRQTFIDAIWPLGMPVIIVGGILGGVCTPTEAGAVAVVYSILVSMFVLKTVTVKDIVPMLYKTILQTSTTLMIISAAKIVSYVLTALQIPAMMGAFSNIFSVRFHADGQCADPDSWHVHGWRRQRNCACSDSRPHCSTVRYQRRAFWRCDGIESDNRLWDPAFRCVPVPGLQYCKVPGRKRR